MSASATQGAHNKRPTADNKRVHAEECIVLIA